MEAEDDPVDFDVEAFFVQVVVVADVVVVILGDDDLDGQSARSMGAVGASGSIF